MSKKKEYPVVKKKGKAVFIDVDPDTRLVRTKEWDHWENRKTGGTWLYPKKDAGKKVGIDILKLVRGVYIGQKVSPIILSSGLLDPKDIKGIAKSVSGSVGYMVEPKTVTVIGSCPGCGASLISAVKFCPNCGRKL